MNDVAPSAPGPDRAAAADRPAVEQLSPQVHVVVRLPHGIPVARDVTHDAPRWVSPDLIDGHRWSAPVPVGHAQDPLDLALDLTATTWGPPVAAPAGPAPVWTPTAVHLATDPHTRGPLVVFDVAPAPATGTPAPVPAATVDPGDPTLPTVHTPTPVGGVLVGVVASVDDRAMPPGTPAAQRVGAYAVVVDRQRVLMAHYPRGDIWGLPGGGIDPDETPAEALARELMEETGLTVGDVTLVALISDRVLTRHRGYDMDYHTVRFVYRASVPDGAEPQVLEVDGSTDESCWVPLADVPGLRLARYFESVLPALLRDPLP